jgi:cell division protein FtsA
MAEQTNTVVGIDVGTTKICTLVGELNAEGAMQIVGVGVTPARGIRKGAVINVTEAGEAIAASVEKAERTCGYQIGRAYVSLAGEHIMSQNSRGVVAVGRGEQGITQEDLDRAIDGAQAITLPHNREILHIIPRGYIVDGQEGVHNPVGMHGFRLEVEAHIITGSTAAVQNLAKCVQAAGVEIDEFVLNPLAAGQAVLTPTEREMGVVLADLGGGTTDIGIFIEGNVWHTVVLPVGGNHITNDVAMGLSLPFEQAEQIKVEHGHARPRAIDAADYFKVMPFGDTVPQNVSRQDLARIIEARVEELFDLILQETKRSGYDGLLPAGVVLCGGTALLPGIRELARERLNMPARVAAPEDLLGLVDTLHSPAYAASVGLLRWGFSEFNMPRPRERHGGSDLGTRLRGWFRTLLPG